MSKSAQKIPLSRPDLRTEDVAELLAVIDSGWLGNGPRVRDFEADFAAFKRYQTPQALALSSCTAALHLALLISGVGPGDEVITTPLTFCATVNAIIHSGATPVLADVDATTLTLDPDAVAAQISPRTRAIVVVHLAGLPCAMTPLLALAERYGLVVIEDCAHAIETRYCGQPAGTLGDFGCFSFYASKNITTGEGGLLLGADPLRIAQARALAQHGLDQSSWQRGAAGAKFAHYQVLDCGYKYAMMDLQAALAIHQLRRLPLSWRRRRRLWQIYQTALTDLPLQLPAEPQSGSRHGYHLYSVRVTADAGCDRDDLAAALSARGIGIGVHYRSLPEHRYYQQRFGWRPQDYPQAWCAGRETLSLPFSAVLSRDEANTVVAALRELLS